ncbi:MAG: glycosyltransferase family 4 protein, partial [Cohaesibacter sp.]|nr:glycosyltransferase family 4 protein [Cohaesibacter sp.]
MDKIIDAIPAGVEIASGLGVDGFEDFLAARKSYYNQILISRSHNMKFINKLIKKRPDLFEECEIIYDAEAVTATRDIMKFDLLGQPMDEKEQLHSLNQEINLTRYADTVIAVSEKEADFYKQGGVPTVKVLGHRFDPEPTPSSFDTRKDLLFVGRLDGDFTPNEDSLIWFAREILPLIQKRSKEPLILNIAGQVNSDRVRNLANNHIRLLGRVDDLSDWYDRSRVFIAPTRFAAGIPHKVHEAANYGLPCVITDLLLSQLGWKHDQEALSASNASDFADQCVRLYEDKALWNSVRSHALEAIKQDCS